MEEEEKQNWTLALANLDELEILTSWINGKDTISTDELLALAPDIKDNDEFLNAVRDHLEQLGVSINSAADINGKKLTESQKEALDWDSIQPEDLLDFYLAELSQQSLLTHAQEIELARQIEMGRRAEGVLEENDCTGEEYARTLHLVERGKAARARLGSANTRLVVSIAKRYRGYGIPFPDLIQNGNVGLMRAVDHYDHRKGFRFSTYATWWIRQAVTRSLSNHGRVIRIPVHTGARIRQMNQVVQRLEMEQGVRPTTEAIAAEMGESPEKIRRMMRWAGDVVSLEQPLGANRELELQDLVEDKNTLQPDETTDRRLLNETLYLLLEKLTVREVQILRLRYGLGGAQSHTLGEIGKKLSLSRERIRQIEREALAKLRLAAPDHRLEQYL